MKKNKKNKRLVSTNDQWAGFWDGFWKDFWARSDQLVDRKAKKPKTTSQCSPGSGLCARCRCNR